MPQPYAVPISCKGVIIEAGKVWLRSNERGEWELPGGKLDESEQPEEAVIREMGEELGVVVSVLPSPLLNHMYHIKTPKVNRHIFVTIYECVFEKRVGEVEHIGEAGKADFKQFSPEEIEGLNMPEFYKKAIEMAFGNR